MGQSVYPLVVGQTKSVTFSSSGTWTVPANCNSVRVTCIGAGASIGGAGAVVKAVIDTSSLSGISIPITVGAPPSPGVNGSAGASSFGSFIIAGGGFAGDLSTPGMSGTTFVSTKTIPPTTTLKPFVSVYNAGDGNTSSVIYSPAGGFWMTCPTPAGFYYTSTDTITWTRRSGGPVNPYSAVTMWYVNGRIYLGYSPQFTYVTYYIMSTSDGITWGSSNNWQSAFSLGTGSYGNILAELLYFTPNSTYYGWGNGQGGTLNTTLALAASTTAPNGTTLTTAVTSITLATWGFCKALTNNTNQIIYFYTGSGTLYSMLFNGTTWTTGNTTVPGSSGNLPTGGFWDGSKYCVSLADGSIYTSTNGTTWTLLTTIGGLIINGITGIYYYGTLNKVFCYSTNLTTWTPVLYKGGSLSSGGGSTGGTSIIAGINGTKFVLPPVSGNGLLNIIDLTSPNVTTSPGYNGVYNTITQHGGAGGEPRVIFSWLYGAGGSSQTFFTVADSLGVDGYGIALSNTNTTPPTYGSTNGLVGQQGAVILEWTA